MKSFIKFLFGCTCSLILVPFAEGVVMAEDPEICLGQKVSSSPVPRHFGWSAAMEGTTAVIGGPSSTSIPGTSPGAAWVFENWGAGWVQTAHLLPASAQAFDEIGNSVAISGDRILVGAPSHGVTNTGAAFVFERSGGGWVETATLAASDPFHSARFGISVAVDGDTAVVGANEHPQGGLASGAAYVFEYVAGTWVEVQRLASSNLTPGDFLGWSVAIQGDWIVVGAVSADGVTSQTGAAYVFHRSASGWVETDKLKAPDGGHTDRFGYSVAICGNRVVAGAPGEGSISWVSGALYVFEFDGTSWLFVQKLKAPDPSIGYHSGSDFLGISVGIDGDELLAGAFTNADAIVGRFDTGTSSGLVNSGSAYLFQFDGTAFAFSRKLRAPDAAPSNQFGSAVALSAGTALIGVPGDSEACPGKWLCEAGAAWFFPAPAFVRGYCFGEGCPCGNDDSARGCARSGGRGAALSACGSASVALDDLAFGATGLTPWQPALLFRGRDAVNGGLGLPFGAGLRCAGGETRRLGTSYADEVGSAGWGPGLVAQGDWQAGDTMRFQAWYRDPELSPCGASFNATSALEAVFEP